MSTRLKRRVVGKAASYTIVYPMDSPGTVFTNDAAVGAITFTLPTASKELEGTEYSFRPVVDQSIVVQPPAVDTAIGLNDVAIDSLALQTGGQKVGGELKALCAKVGSGYQWILSNSSVGHAATLVT